MADLSLSLTHVTTWQISLSDVTTWRISLSLSHTRHHMADLSLTHTRHHMADLSLSHTHVTTWQISLSLTSQHGGLSGVFSVFNANFLILAQTKLS